MGRRSGWWRVGLVLAVVGCGVPPGPDGDDDDTDPTEPADAPWFCAPAASAEPLDGGGWRLETEHYGLSIWLDRAEAETLARLVEAAWEAQVEWFGAEPALAGERLEVEVHASVADWEQSIAEDGLEVPFGAGGYYHPTTGVAYLYRQPTTWYTRVLTIHEVVHQFHDRSRSVGGGLPGWYLEGIAEHLALHDWDGECVRLGRLPMLSQEDLPASAATQAGDGFDLQGLVVDDAGMTRPLSWAAVRFFDVGLGDDGSERFAAFRAAVDGGAVPGDAFVEAFEAEPGGFVDDLVDWLADEQQPMTPTYLEWIHTEPGAVDGFADVFSIAPVKGEVAWFEADFEVPDTDPWFGGVVYAYEDPSNWRAVGVGSDGQVSTFEVAGDAVWWGQGPAPDPIDGTVRFAVEHGGGSSTVTVNAALELELDRPLAPAGGVALSASTLSFRGIAWD